MNTCMSDEEINSLGERYNIIQCSEYSCVNNVPYISIDNKQAGYDAVSHLLSLGRRRIAYLGVKNHFTSSHLRFDGYIAALRENGIEEDRDIIFDGNYGYNSSIKLTDEFLEKKVKFDAMFAISDRMAAGAITSMKNHGLKVPEDIAVVGFDNTSISYIYEPNITTVAQPQNELGEKAFQMMYDKIKKNEPKNIFLTHKIIVRKSTQI
ncbi:MAG: substrate-binding domain-containing protein [Oscillospiraceae bacterium]